jgi:hypothetical protein
VPRPSPAPQPYAAHQAQCLSPGALRTLPGQFGNSHELSAWATGAARACTAFRQSTSFPGAPSGDTRIGAHVCVCIHARACVRVYACSCIKVCVLVDDFPVSAVYAQHACMYASESQRAPILNPHCTARACPRSRTADPPQTHDKNTLSHRCFFTVLSSALLWYVLRNTFPLMILCYRMCSLNSMFSE